MDPEGRGVPGAPLDPPISLTTHVFINVQKMEAKKNYCENFFTQGNETSQAVIAIPLLYKSK